MCSEFDKLTREITSLSDLDQWIEGFPRTASIWREEIEELRETLVDADNTDLWDEEDFDEFCPGCGEDHVYCECDDGIWN